MEPMTFEADKEEKLEISFGLEEDPVCNDELSSPGLWGRSIDDEEYRIAEQQLLQEGKLGNTEISAHIKKATFGVYKEQPACLIHLGLDFCPKNGRSFFRFRDAAITVEFEEVDDGIPRQKEEKRPGNSSDNDKAYDRPTVLGFYPTIIQGHIQYSVHTLGAKLYAEPAGIGLGAEISGSKTFLKEGKHLIHGRIKNRQRVVKWNISENEATKSGIYEQPSLAVIVKYSVGRGFAMKLVMTATTYGALSVKGKKGPRIIFKTPDKQMDTDLGKRDLEELTKMRAALLAKEGPGGGEWIRAEQDFMLGRSA